MENNRAEHEWRKQFNAVLDSKWDDLDYVIDWLRKNPRPEVYILLTPLVDYRKKVKS